MRRFMLVLALGACGGSKPVPDAGPVIDTSCGIDCDAQKTYGLLVGTCFEYTDMGTAVSPPALAAEVLPKSTLEGGVPVMKVQYSTGGQIKMTDSFTITDGVLKLVRREWAGASNSVSYQKADNSLDGVKWISPGDTAGSNEQTSENARFLHGATDTTETVDYRVTFSAGSAGELNVPAGNFSSGLKLLFSETPDHGADTRRIFVDGTGFTLIATPLMPAGGTSQEYRLQNLKNTGDAGTACGFQ
jgi:hypothetical protein